MLSSLYKLSAIVKAVVSVVLFIWSYQVLAFFGADAGWYSIYLARLACCFVFAMAIYNWYASESKDESFLRGAFLANLLLSVVATIVAIFGQAAGYYNQYGWAVVVVFGAFALAYLYFGFSKGEAKFA